MNIDFGAFLRTLRTHDAGGNPISWQQALGHERLTYTKEETSSPNRGRRIFNDVDVTEGPGQAIDLTAWRLDTITKGEPPPQRFLLAPLFPEGTVGVLFGPGGVGKSLVALDLCLAVGRQAITPKGSLNFVVGPLGGSIPAEAGGAAIFITLEDSAPEIHRRTVSLDASGAREGAPVFVIPGIEMPEFNPVLVAERGRTGVLTEFAHTGLPRLLDSVADACPFRPRLLVLDPAGDFMDGDENSAAVVKPLMRRLREVAREYDCTIILVGHVSKSLDPSAPTMRGSNAWVANSRFAYSLSPPVPPKGARASPSDATAGSLVWGELVKANHAGAPIGRRKPFQRDAATGRLIDASGLVAKPEQTEGELLNALVLACLEADKAGTPFTISNRRGLYQRRSELPEALAELSRGKLESLGKAAAEDEWLARDDDGNLIAPPG